ncbi:MAG: response regulator [Moraxellaceae bacterium]|nr:response regulator [Pseudobdellovibrionaceae bacterium]
MKSRIDVLIVDDRLDGLIALEAILEGTRYNLVTARSGLEALELAPKYNFAVILLDVQMPGIDGFETAMRLKNIPTCRYTPIIFVTAINKDDTYVFKGYQSGAVDYVFKPFDENILRSKVSVFADLFEKSIKIEEQTQQLKKSAANEHYLRLAQLEVESLKRYQNLANSIPHAVWRSKADGTMDYFNRGWRTYTGLSDQQSHGLGWQVAFEPDDLKVFLRTWMKNIGHAGDFEVEGRIKNAEGESRWNLIKAIAETTTNGEIIAWLGTCTDIHDRKITEEKLIKAQQEADAANAAKTNFLANMSHEIRTPLNSILGFTELMMGPLQSADDQIKNLAIIKKNGNSLLKIINEILDISKVETGHLEMEVVETDLRHLLIDIHTLLEVQAHEKCLKLNFRCSNPIPNKIMTDPTRYRQILVNIIGNSIKFTKSGQVDLEIGWHPDTENPHCGILRCFVIDTGIGIDSEDAKNLFQPFAQVDSSKSRRFGGTGLGLALSLRLAKALNGDAYIKESKVDQGSTFQVDIRTTMPGDADLVGRLDMSIKEAEPAVINYKNSLRQTRILVVDDSSDNRNLISQFLLAAGAEVDCAVDGIDGVGKALAKDYEIILMDIQMPNLDGHKATAQLREKGYSRPIIALTAHALKQERINSINAGCDDHLTKPIDRRTLIEQVAKHKLKMNKPQKISTLI